MSEAKRPAGLSKEEEALAWAALGVLVTAVAVVVGAIFMA